MVRPTSWRTLSGVVLSTATRGFFTVDGPSGGSLGRLSRPQRDSAYDTKSTSFASSAFGEEAPHRLADRRHLLVGELGEHRQAEHLGRGGGRHRQVVAGGRSRR